MGEVEDMINVVIVLNFDILIKFDFLAVQNSSIGLIFRPLVCLSV